jgi:hypothetical protein
VRLVRRFKDNLDIAVPTAGTLQAGCELIDREWLAIDKVPRLRRAQEAMKACRRAWNVARRIEPANVPAANPFEKAEVEAPKAGKTVPATWDQR